MTALIGALLLVGLFFHAVAALGVVLTVSALVLAAGPSLLGAKLALVAVFLLLANPTSTHAIARAALRTGLRPWRREAGGSPPGGEATG